MACCIFENHLHHVAPWHHMSLRQTEQMTDYETNRIVCDNDYSKC